MWEIFRTTSSGKRLVVIVRDGTASGIGFYCSNADGLLLRQGFAGFSEAANYAFAILGED